MKRVAGYGRVSTIGQAKDGTGLEDQENAIIKKCKEEGYELVRFYHDDGISGKSLDRPALDELINDAKDGKFDVVMFTKLDRLGRNLRDLLNLCHRFEEEFNVDIYCIYDPRLNSTGSPMDKAMFGFMATVAELERDFIKERTQNGRRIKWESGESFMGELPFGYQKDKKSKKIVIAEPQASIYKKIVSYYLDDRLSSKKIAIQLTRSGVDTPSVMKGKKIKTNRWSGATIVAILRNSAYMGEVYYNKNNRKKIGANSKNHMLSGNDKKPEDEWIKVTFPPLISEDTWQQLQAMMRQQKVKNKRIYKGYENNFLFDGLLYCGECGGKMHKQLKLGNDGKTYLYYNCSWHGISAENREAEGRAGCNLKSVNASKTDNELFAQICKLLTEPTDFFQAWYKDLNHEELKEKVLQLEKKDKDMRKILGEAFNIITSTEDPSLKRMYQDTMKKKEKEWQELQPDLENAKREYKNSLNKIKRYEAFKEVMKKNESMIGSKKLLPPNERLQKFMNDLPFPEKRRIVESIVSPEQGGKCFVQYVRPIDFLDYEDLHDVPKEKLDMPLIDTKPYAYGYFMIDPNRVEKVITSLNRDSLLRQDDLEPPPLLFFGILPPTRAREGDPGPVSSPPRDVPPP